MLALSTAWNASRYHNGIELVKEIQELGFRNLELSFNLTPQIVKDILSLYKTGAIKVVSLHNFCPIPDKVQKDKALPDYYSLASLNSQTRAKAVKQTKRTIDTARQFQAKVVILHCGRAEVPDRTRELIGLFEKGLADSQEYNQLRLQSIQERQKQIGPFLEQVLLSLDELSKYCQGSGITLGIENRFYLREIPDFKEMGVILETFKSPNISYWHDIGHAQVQENLGISRQLDYLDAFSKRLTGIHLHGVVGGRDHLAPLEGQIDFAQFNKYLSQDSLKVIESHSPATAQQLIHSTKALREIFQDYD